MSCEIVSKFFQAMDSFHQEWKESIDLGVNCNISNSEISFIRAVHNNPGVNAVQLSNILNVTRGAITQWGNSLEKNSIIEKQSKEDNKKEKYFSLTSKGVEIYEAFEKYHETPNREMCKYISSLKESDRRVIKEFLEKMSNLSVSDFQCSYNFCGNNKFMKEWWYAWVN